jgi:hypothetical protein
VEQGDPNRKHQNGLSPLAVKVSFGSKTDLTAPKSNFRSTPESGLNSDIASCPDRASNGLMHRNKRRSYSITSSARPSSVAVISMPSALAVFRLIANSNFVGRSTGRSAGFAPFRILSTKIAARR